MKRAVIIAAVVWVGMLGVRATNLEASEIEKPGKIPESSIYQVSGRKELFLLEEEEWRYISSMDIIYSLGHTEKDINKNTDIVFFCQYPVGYPMPGGWADSSQYGYSPHKDWYIIACQEIETAPNAAGVSSLAQPETIDSLRWFYSAPTYPHDIARGIETFKRIKALGYNVASVNWSPPAHASSTWSWDMYGSVLEAAKEAGLPIMAWIGWQPGDIQGFMSRYAEDTTIWGWYSQDEPLIAGASKEWQQQCYNVIKAGDPHNRPVISTFSTATYPQYVKGWQPSSFDIAAFDIYPYAIAGETQTTAERHLKHWANYWAPIFRKAGKQVIPMLQAFSDTKGAPVDILSQYEWWQESSMPILPGSFATYGTSTCLVLSELDTPMSDIDTHIGKGIRDLNRKLGWLEEASGGVVVQEVYETQE